MEIKKTADSVISTFTPLSTTTVAIKSQEAMNFITGIFSDKIYKNKPLAVVRELIANAVDEHVKHGVARDVEVYLPQPGNPIFSVRDFAKGLPHDMMENVYAAFGESTKRQDNICTGGLGLGAKSPACLTDAWTVTSYHEGMERSYAVYKKDGALKMDLLLEAPTTQSGILVEVPLPKNMAITEFNEQTFEYLSILNLPVTVTNLYLNEEESENRYVLRAGLFKGVLPKFNTPYGYTISKLDFGFRQDGPVYQVNGIDVKIKTANTSLEMVENYCKDPLKGLISETCVQQYVIMGAAYYTYEMKDIFPDHGELRSQLERLGTKNGLFNEHRHLFELPIGSLDITPDRERTATTEKTREALRAAWSAYLVLLVKQCLCTLKKHRSTDSRLGTLFLYPWYETNRRYLNTLRSVIEAVTKKPDAYPLTIDSKHKYEMEELISLATEIEYAFCSRITVCRGGGSYSVKAACGDIWDSNMGVSNTKTIYLDEATLPVATDPTDLRDLVKIRRLVEGQSKEEILQATRLPMRNGIRFMLQSRQPYIDKWFGEDYKSKTANKQGMIREADWLSRNKNGGWSLIRRLKDGKPYANKVPVRRSQTSTGTKVRRANGEIPCSMVLRGSLFSLHSWAAYTPSDGPLSAWHLNYKTEMGHTDVRSYTAEELYHKIRPGLYSLNKDVNRLETLEDNGPAEYDADDLVANLAISYNTSLFSGARVAAHLWVLLDKSHKSLLVLQNRDTYATLKKLGCQEVDLNNCQPDIDLLRLRKRLSLSINHVAKTESMTKRRGPSSEYMRYVRYGLALSEDIEDEEYKVNSLLVGAMCVPDGFTDKIEELLYEVMKSKYNVSVSDMEAMVQGLRTIWDKFGTNLAQLYDDAFKRIKAKNTDSCTTVMATYLLNNYWYNDSSVRSDTGSMQEAGRKHMAKHHLLRPVHVILEGNTRSRIDMERLEGMMACLPYYNEEKEIVKPARKLAAAAIKEEKELFARFCKANKLK